LCQTTPERSSRHGRQCETFDQHLPSTRPSVVSVSECTACVLFVFGSELSTEQPRAADIGHYCCGDSFVTPRHPPGRLYCLRFSGRSDPAPCREESRRSLVHPASDELSLHHLWRSTSSLDAIPLFARHPNTGCADATLRPSALPVHCSTQCLAMSGD